MRFIDALISKLAPHICLGCGQEGALLCMNCIDLLPDPSAHTPITGLDSVQAATIYDSFAKDLVWQLKFRGAREAANIMARCMTSLVPADRNNLIVPVPTATRRVRQRGFDQAKLLARQLSKRSGRYTPVLQRHGQTHQVGASREQRLRQLTEAFTLKKDVNLQSRRVILVDDVLTTGATLEAAANVVKKARPASIEALVFAYAE